MRVQALTLLVSCGLAACKPTAAQQSGVRELEPAEAAAEVGDKAGPPPPALKATVNLWRDRDSEFASSRRMPAPRLAFPVRNGEKIALTHLMLGSRAMIILPRVGGSTRCSVTTPLAARATTTWEEGCLVELDLLKPLLGDYEISMEGAPASGDAALPAVLRFTIVDFAPFSTVRSPVGTAAAPALEATFNFHRQEGSYGRILAPKLAFTARDGDEIAVFYSIVGAKVDVYVPFDGAATGCAVQEPGGSRIETRFRPGFGCAFRFDRDLVPGDYRVTFSADAPVATMSFKIKAQAGG